MTLKDELITAIQNEDLNFDMSHFKEIGKELSTHTALCMGGHIMALRPERAKVLREELRMSSAKTAARIWQEEMNEPCTLDFFAREGQIYSRHLKDITRAEAVEHILGTSLIWPRMSIPKAIRQYA